MLPRWRLLQFPALLAAAVTTEPPILTIMMVKHESKVACLLWPCQIWIQGASQQHSWVYQSAHWLNPDITSQEILLWPCEIKSAMKISVLLWLMASKLAPLSPIMRENPWPVTEAQFAAANATKAAKTGALLQPWVFCLVTQIFLPTNWEEANIVMKKYGCTPTSDFAGSGRCLLRLTDVENQVTMLSTKMPA